ADREPYDVAPVELRVRDENLTGGVDTSLELLVLLIGSVPAEDDEGETPRRDELPVVALLDPACEKVRKADVLADDRAQPLRAVAAQPRPELQRADPSA